MKKCFSKNVGVKMKKKNKHFVGKNKCAYCTYSMDSAGILGNADATANAGDLAFCLMCCNALQFDGDMKLIKFDIDSIPGLLERNRIKGIQFKMIEFWDKNPSKAEKREKYLKIMDSRHK